MEIQQKLDSNSLRKLIIRATVHLFKFYEQFGLIHTDYRTKHNKALQSLYFTCYKINITKKKNKQTKTPTCKKCVIDRASDQDGCTLKMQ